MVCTQADVYDSTRKRLLQGREDMLGLVAAQLMYKASQGAYCKRGPIWVDVRFGDLEYPPGGKPEMLTKSLDWRWDRLQY